MSKFKDTSMLRVIDEDMENDDNYLRNLEHSTKNE